VACGYNPRYSGDSDQEDSSLKLVRANNLRDPILKNINLSQKRASVVAQGVGSEFKNKKLRASHSWFNFVSIQSSQHVN
jgi:hypothetical protein